MMQEYKREVTQLVHAWLATSRHGSYLKWMTRIAEYLQVVWLTGFESRCRLLGLSQIQFSIQADFVSNGPFGSRLL